MKKILLLTNEDGENIQKYMPDEDTVKRLSDFFSILSDATRVKIISALSMCEMCVNDLSVLLDINQTTLSHQLKLLRQWGAVKGMRDGKMISYSLASEGFNNLMMEGVNMLF